MATRVQSAAALAVLLLAAPGCRPRVDEGASGRLGCIVPLTRSVCAPVPHGSQEGCRLFTWEGRPISRWSFDESELPGVCPEGSRPLLIDGRRADAAASRPPVLLCPAPPGERCPAGRTGSVVRCELAGAGRVDLGEGETAASLASDGSRVAAVWGSDRADDGTLRLRWQLLDADLAPQPTAATGVPTTRTCNALNAPGGLDRVTLWSEPRLIDEGAEVAVVGGCSRETSSVQRLRFRPEEARSVILCADVGSQVSGVGLTGGELPWLALTVDCGRGQNLLAAPCVGGPLALPLDDAEFALCDLPALPALAPPRGEQVPWVGAASVPPPEAAGDPPADAAVATLRQVEGRSTTLTIQTVADPADPDRFVRPPRTVLTDVAVAFDSGAEGTRTRPTLVAEGHTVAMAWADPVAGVLLWRSDYTVERGWTRGDDVTLVEPGIYVGADALAPLPGGPDAASLAVARPGGPDATVAICYPTEDTASAVPLQSLLLIAHDARGVRGPIGFIPPRPGKRLACGISSTTRACAEQGAAAFVYVHQGPAVAGGDPARVLDAKMTALSLPDRPDLNSGARLELPSGEGGVDPDRVVDLQMVSLDTDWVVLAGLDDGSYQALRLTFGGGCVALGPQLESLWTLAPEAHRDRPLLTRHFPDGQLTALVTYLDPDGRPHAVEPLRCAGGGCEPGRGAPDLLAGSPLEAERVAVFTSAGAVGTVHAGPYAPGGGAALSGPMTSSAWYQVDTGEPQRAGQRVPVSLASPSLLGTPSGRTLVAFAPGDAALAAPTATVGRADGPADQQAVVARFASTDLLHDVALGARHGAGPHERVLLASTTRQAQRPALHALQLDAEGQGTLGPEVRLQVELAHRDAQAAGAPALVSLEGGSLPAGVLALTYCYAAAGALHRVLVPIDHQGQPLGPPLPLGSTALSERLDDRGGESVAVCPPATLIRHGERLLLSAVQAGRVAIDEVVCAERPVSFGR